jgi:hypothetical protein
LAAVAIIIGLALAGGGDGDSSAVANVADTPSPTVTASRAATASPTPSGQAHAVGCEFPSYISSFRFTVTMEANLPSTATREPSSEQGPADAFLEELRDLPGDVKMEGAVIKLDRGSMEMTVDGHEFGSFIQIGSQSWAKAAGLTDWTEEPASEESDLLLSPLDLCENAEEDLSSLSQLEGERETVNGIEAVHHRFDRADLTYLQEFLGTTVELGDWLEEFTGEVWLAEDGRWPVRMSFEASGEDAQHQPFSFDMFVEFKDFNDSSIEIDPPT